MTLRRSLTATVVLLALLLATASGALEPVVEWTARQIHQPVTHYQDDQPESLSVVLVSARPRPDDTRIVSMARYYHCNIVATPGPDWFHGHTVRGWIIGVEGKRYFHAHPSFWGWEPRGPDFIKAVCQL